MWFRENTVKWMFAMSYFQCMHWTVNVCVFAILLLLLVFVANLRFVRLQCKLVWIVFRDCCTCVWKCIQSILMALWFSWFGLLMLCRLHFLRQSFLVCEKLALKSIVVGILLMWRWLCWRWWRRRRCFSHNISEGEFSPGGLMAVGEMDAFFAFLQFSPSMWVCMCVRSCGRTFLREKKFRFSEWVCVSDCAFGSFLLLDVEFCSELIALLLVDFWMNFVWISNLKLQPEVKNSFETIFWAGKWFRCFSFNFMLMISVSLFSGWFRWICELRTRKRKY